MTENDHIEAIRENGRINKSSGDPGNQYNELVQSLQNKIGQEAFERWYRERQFAENIRKGQHYFNGPSGVQDIRRKSPSKLLQCKRKAYYRELSAPGESSKPTGIFWTGSKIEEEIIQPYLEEAVAGDDEYVANSIWIDFLISTDAGKVRIKGSTDPVVVDEKFEPILLFEVKSQRRVENIDQPKRHHVAQAHAYLRGLQEKSNPDLREVVIIYVGRTHFDFRSFNVKFDSEFWEEVKTWIADVTAYRLEEELPPADPEFNWECEYCDYRNRCGKGPSQYANLDAQGFVPGVADYPREKVIEHLETYPDEKLTPTLAEKFPELANNYGVFGWHCPICDSQITLNAVPNDGEPLCPQCAEEGQLSHLIADCSDLSDRM